MPYSVMLEWIITTIMAPLRGKKPFWFVFWVYAVLINGLLSLAQLAASFYIFPLPISLQSAFGNIWSGFGFVYDLWINIAMWQCAFNGTSKITAYITRFGVVLSIAYTLISLLLNPFSMDIIPLDANAQAESEQLMKIIDMLKH